MSNENSTLNQTVNDTESQQRVDNEPTSGESVTSAAPGAAEPARGLDMAGVTSYKFQTTTISGQVLNLQGFSFPHGYAFDEEDSEYSDETDA